MGKRKKLKLEISTLDDEIQYLGKEISFAIRD